MWEERRGGSRGVNGRENTANKRTDKEKKYEGEIHKHILKGAEYGLSGYCGLQYDERHTTFYEAKLKYALLEK